jgi:hypothetical protein
MELKTPAVLHSTEALQGASKPSTRAATPQNLEDVNRPNVVTADAAYYLNRRPQTLRGWASTESGPLRPIRVNGRLAWPVSELRRVLGVTC